MSVIEGQSLKGRVALITGASRGLGKAIALALGSAGAHLALVSRNSADLESAGKEVRAAGADVQTFPANVASEEQVIQVEKKVLSCCGPVDILVNNAGINPRKPMEQFTLEEWNLVLATNLTSAFLLCRSFVPHMKGRGYGRIINITSTMSHVAIPGRTAYCATKAGLLGFTKALSLELAPEGITVVGISPGPFATDMNAVVRNDANQRAQFVSRIPLGRWGNAEEVGRLALYLCSPDADFITGTDILIDGGWTAQ